MSISIMGHIKDLLTRLHKGGFPEAIVAGGVLRDWTTGKEREAKDIDVFVEDHPGYLHDLLETLTEFKCRLAVPERVAQYMQFENVNCVQEFTSAACPLPVQVIVMCTSVVPQKLIERHDFGACQIGYDGCLWYMTPAFQRDVCNQTFTLVRCRDAKDKARSLKRWERLSTKYQGWKLVC